MAEKKIKKEPEKTFLKMYIGPAIRKYGLTPGTIYEGISLGNVQAAIEKYPEIKELFVDVDNNFAKNKDNVKVSGTKENIFYKKLLKKLGGK